MRAETLGSSRAASISADEMLGLLDFSEQRYADALVRLERLAGVLREEAVGEPSLLGAAPERIESLARAGRPDEAAAALAELSGQAAGAQSRWGQAAAERCAGIVASEDGFEGAFEASLAWHDQIAMPFERARTELCFGERLRRAKRRAEARGHLRQALEVFRAVGARPFVDRAEQELAATGERARRRDPTTTEELTPQELREALAVAEGASNREVATALFLSAKTVEFHLGAVYRKLGIGSRTELARRFAQPRS